MVPSDLRKSNLTVDRTLLVRGNIATPEITTTRLVVRNLVVQDLQVTNEAIIPNITPSDGGGNGGGSAPSNIVLTTGNQTINGIKTFTSGVPITATANQLELGTGAIVTISAPTPATSSVYTIPDSGPAADFVMTEGAQTINNTKTFTSGVSITALSNQLELGSGTTTTISAPVPATSAVYTIPDSGPAADFVMTEGIQTINGAKTLSDTTTFGTGILLPTTGGTPTLFNFYEELTGSIDWISNAFVGTRSIAFQVVRNGSQVIFFSNGLPLEAASGSAGTILSSSDIPARFLPSAVVSGAILTFASVTSNSVRVIGAFRISQGGNFVISAGPAEGSQFANTGNIGFQPFISSWTIPGPQ